MPMWGPSWAKNRSQEGSRSDLQNDPQKGSENIAKMGQHGPQDPPPKRGPKSVQNRPRDPPSERLGAKTPPGPLRDPPLRSILVPGAPLPDPPGTPKSLIWELFWKPNSSILNPFPVRTSTPNWSTLGALLQCRSWPPRCAAAVYRVACSIQA